VPAGTGYAVDWDGAARALCCRGCEAVARTILDSGLGDYYRHRSAAAPSARAPLPAMLRDLAAFDHPEVQMSFVRQLGERREAALILDGVTCAACVWLNEQHLRLIPGVLDVQVNYTTRRLRVAWDEARIHLSQILAAIRGLGYDAHPYDPARSQQLLAAERRTLLRRLGIAGIFGAQVMTLSVALYVGDWGGSDPAMRNFFHWISLLLTLPVLLYSAQPFFRAAWNDLRHARAGMDVPIALGLAAAFAASLWTTLTDQGVAYYDAVTMFAFLLLGGRYFELIARTRATESAEALVQAAPAIATRRRADGTLEQVAVAELEVGDSVLIRPGETIAADGVVEEGGSSVNEALLTGESLPLAKRVGDPVIGGALNVESPLTVRVTRTGADTVLSAMLRLLDRAQGEKPRLAQIADRVAAYFVVGVIVIAAVVGLYWLQTDPARALPIVIAVLVVTCPCALGLATPAALAAATGALARLGVLTTRGHALETLARATHFVFDKTGTLTRGELRVRRIEPLSDATRERCIALAAALERYSEHPIARAILALETHATLSAQQVVNAPGEGLEGEVDGQTYYLGTPAFIERRTGLALDFELERRAHAGTVVALASTRQLLAAFLLQDTPRDGARELIGTLQRLGKSVTLLTGDHEQAARQICGQLGIKQFRAQLKPADKLAAVEALQRQGAIVAMTGDGVNDAPVLAAAQVSIAMGSSAQVTAAAGDMILLASDLRRLIDAVRIARRTLGIVRQNLTWAIAYNLLAVPAAATGLVTPWMAALGMSASSLLVIANALRLTRRGA
jgi:Cu2+-exporting ATPase